MPDPAPDDGGHPIGQGIAVADLGNGIWEIGQRTGRETARYSWWREPPDAWTDGLGQRCVTRPSGNLFGETIYCISPGAECDDGTMLHVGFTRVWGVAIPEADRPGAEAPGRLTDFATST